MPDGRPNVLFFHVDNLGFGELSCYSGGPFRGCITERIDAFAREGFRFTNYCPESQCTPTRSALLTGRYSVRSGTHSVPIGQSGGWGLVAWEKTLGDVLSAAGYRCAAYGKWHVGEGPGRWPTDKGFLEWYGPARTYDKALWPTDPWYDPQRDPVSRMLESKRGDADVTEGDQLTLDVRRDCDTEYLRRAETFVRRQAQAGTPFFVYFNHSLMHMPVIPRSEFKGSHSPGRLGRQPHGTGLRLRRLAGPARRTGYRVRHPCHLRRGQRARGRTAVAGHARLLGRLLFRRRGGQPAHSLHCALARSYPPRADQRRHHARHRLVHHGGCRHRRFVAP